MASLFDAKISFEMPDNEQMEQLETLIEHFNLCDYDDARDLLNANQFDKAVSMFNQLITRYFTYTIKDDPVRIYTELYDQYIDDLELSFDDSGRRGKIKVEGVDHTADSFCSVVILFLIAMGAEKINAEASGPEWEARWHSREDGSIELWFNVDE